VPPVSALPTVSSSGPPCLVHEPLPSGVLGSVLAPVPPGSALPTVSSSGSPCLVHEPLPSGVLGYVLAPVSPVSAIPTVFSPSEVGGPVLSPLASPFHPMSSLPDIVGGAPFPPGWGPVLTRFKAWCPQSTVAFSELFPSLGAARNFPELLATATRLAVFDSDLERASRVGTAVVANLLPQARVTIGGHLDVLRTRGLQPILEAAQLAASPRALNSNALQTVDPASPFFDRLRCLATHSNRALYPPEYRPNCGVGVQLRPEWQAPKAALAAHFLKLHAKENMVILQRDLFAAYCQRHSRL
jgi:hypothetical protein